MYVLVSETTGRHDVGHTENLQRRLAEHNDSQHNQAKYTTKHPGPWRLIYPEAHTSRAEAMAPER